MTAESTEIITNARRAEILALLTKRPRRLDWLMARYGLSRHSIIRDISILRRGRVIDTVQAGRVTWYELVN